MSQTQWSAVDQYINGLVVRSDFSLDATLESIAAAGLPPINVTPAHGKLLHLMARAQGARRILEIGTLAGYSTIWLARALPPDGRIITLEQNQAHADIAHANFARAGVEDRVEVLVGAALDTLPLLADRGDGPFDFTFIDADRPNLTEYFSWALQLSRVGSLIVVDNVVRRGGVIDPASEDANVVGVRRFVDRLSAEERVSATIVQTVSAKGYDGFALALVIGN